MKEIIAFIQLERLLYIAKNFKREYFCCFTEFQGDGVVELNIRIRV
tara:strand:+ start:14579 stop:14716 length:138 start_codon:yes stop_codon:yes gene_type:complete